MPECPEANVAARRDCALRSNPAAPSGARRRCRRSRERARTRFAMWLRSEMAFATAAHFRRSLHIGGVAVLAAGIVGCATKASTVMHSEPAAQAEIIPDSDPSPSPPPPPVPAQTTTTACTPIGVFRLKATNQTQSKGDLCARFEAAVMQTSMQIGRAN